MPFTTTGTFTPDTNISPLQNLMAAAKKKKAPATTPANVYAPAITPERSAGMTPIEAPIRSITPINPPSTPELPIQEPTQPPPSTPSTGDMPDPLPAMTGEIHYINNDPESPYYWETLGYADASWAGLPFEMGFWQTQPDGTQIWIQQRDMRPVAEQMWNLAHTAIPERPELLDLTATPAMQGIEDLIAIWNDPGTAMADRNAAVAQFASEMGMSATELTAMLNSMLGQANLGVQGQTGLTDEYTDTYNRETALELQEMQANYKKMLESMSASGRSVAGFYAMDEVARSMSSYQLQRDLERMNIDMAVKTSEYDALMQRWGQLYEQKEMTAQQLIENIQQNRMNALTGYAQEMSVYVQQNQLTLEAYSADLQAASLHAEIAYKSIMADMGVSESMMTQMQDYYEMYMAPYYAELDAWAIETQAAQAQQANEINMLTTAFQVIGIIAMVATSAICREMYRQGLFPKEYLEMDGDFGRIVMIRRPDVFEGYLKLCNWIIPKMQKSHAFTMFVNIFFQAWIKDMAVLMGRSKKGSLLGRLINKIGFWFCSLIGREIAEVRYGYVG